MLRILALLLLIAAPARADVAAAVDLIGRSYADFAVATADLDARARESCAGLEAPFHRAADAWMAVQHVRLGPVEEGGRALAISFWPDPKALGARAQRGLLTGDPADLAPARFAEQSVAARGLSGLERLIWPDRPLPADPCPLIRATAADLARMATAIRDEWPAFATDLTTAGAAGNTAFLTADEAKQALFTQLISGLAFIADQRLGRPLGSFDKPRPERAESRASGRSQRNVQQSLSALADYATALAPGATGTAAAFARAEALAAGLEDPTLGLVADPQGWLKVQILQQAVHALRDQALAEIAPALGVGLGFNAQDGD